MAGKDDVFDALAKRQRRQLLLDLLDRDPQRVSELSGVSRELACAHDALLDEYLASTRTGREVDENLLRMHHLHLPKLAEYGFIAWCRETHVVTRGARFDEIEPYLELLLADQETRPEQESAVGIRG